MDLFPPQMITRLLPANDRPNQPLTRGGRPDAGDDGGLLRALHPTHCNDACRSAYRVACAVCTWVQREMSSSTAIISSSILPHERSSWTRAAEVRTHAVRTVTSPVGHLAAYLCQLRSAVCPVFDHLEGDAMAWRSDNERCCASEESATSSPDTTMSLEDFWRL